MRNVLFRVKKLWVLILFASLSLNAADSEERAERVSRFGGEKEERVSRFDREKEPSSGNVYVYATADWTLPGVGVCGRFGNKKRRIETNLKVLYPGIGYASLSALPTLFQSESGLGYIGLGAGIGFSAYDMKYPIPVVPLFLGYEGEIGFIDLGSDILVAPGGFIPIVPVPTVRIGCKF